MKIGDTVRHKESGQIGIVKYSTFGVKIGGTYEDGRRWKTNGYSVEELAEYWEVIEEEQ